MPLPSRHGHKIKMLVQADRPQGYYHKQDPGYSGLLKTPERMHHPSNSAQLCCHHTTDGLGTYLHSHDCCPGTWPAIRTMQMGPVLGQHPGRLEPARSFHQHPWDGAPACPVSLCSSPGPHYSSLGHSHPIPLPTELRHRYQVQGPPLS